VTLSAQLNEEIKMLNKSILAMALLAPLTFSTTVLAQTMDGVDPACIIKNQDGTQKVDTVKCPDGKQIGTGSQTQNNSQQPADAAGQNATGTNSTTNDQSATGANSTTTDQTTTSSTTSPPNDILVAPDKMTGSKILSANDFIGQTVYSRANENVGKVADVILSENGVQAVVLGVGGFLGMGSKDVAVKMSSIQVSQDGSSTKLIVDASKDQLKAAPTYDIKSRTYMN
jgi:sporulation protein YlmC with PRC-barrel domain